MVTAAPSLTPAPVLTARTGASLTAVTVTETVPVSMRTSPALRV